MEQRLRLVQSGPQPRSEKRTSERRPIALAGQIVWKDARGNTKLTEVVTRDVSEHGVAVECVNGTSIPLYRLVYFQVARDARQSAGLPPALRKPNVLSAIFRVGSDNQATGAPCQYALRLLVEPARPAQPVPVREAGWSTQVQQPLTA
jgi:hypothetical protein